MAISNGYCTLAELKSALGIPTADTDDDTELEDTVEAASRNIDRFAGRRFYVNSVDETRYFTPDNSQVLWTGTVDIVSITTLKSDEDGDGTFEITWAAGDYSLGPKNASLDGLPYSYITISLDGDYSFPALLNGVEIVGKFGFPSVPEDIKRACIILAARLWKRRDAPFGVIGSPELGQVQVINKVDPDVMSLVGPYIRRM